jgi:hypothetical protein
MIFFCDFCFFFSGDLPVGVETSCRSYVMHVAKALPCEGSIGCSAGDGGTNALLLFGVDSL